MKAKGFTLVELLVVISIIALLMAVLIPAIDKARKITYAAICCSNLRQWYIMADIYTTNNDGFFWEGWDGSSYAGSNWWMNALRKYYSDIDEIRCCPTATKTRFELDGSPGPGTNKTPFMAWGYRKSFFGTEDYGSYAVNGWLENEQRNSSDRNKHWRKIDKVKDATNVPLMLDAQWIDTWPKPNIARPPTAENEDIYGHYTDNNYMMVRVCQNRHDGKEGCAFMDGHARKVGLKELWTLKWYDNFETQYDSTTAKWGSGAPLSAWKEAGADWILKYKAY